MSDRGARSRRLLVGLVGFGLFAVAGCSTLAGARLYREGTRALERGDSAAAIVALERAAELVPEASEVQNHLGLAYLSAGRRAEALRAFERAIELDCDNAAARHNRDEVRRRAVP